MYLLSALGGGLFIIPLLSLLGSIFCFYKGYQATEDKTVKKVISSGGGVFGVLLLLTTIVITIVMYSER